MQDLRTYTYDELLGMEGQEIEFRNNTKTQIKIDNTYVYHIDKVKIRGLRGASVFIDFFNEAKENVVTISVFKDNKINIYDILYPEFTVLKNA